VLNIFIEDNPMAKKFQNKKDIDNIAPSKKSYELYGDSKQDGLYLKVTNKGTKTFIIKFPDSSRKKLELYDKINTDLSAIRDAVDDKIKEFDRIAKGISNPKKKQNFDITLKDMTIKYLEYMKGDKMDSTLQYDKALFNNHIEDKLGNKKPWLITSREMIEFLNSIKNKTHQYSYITSLDGIEVKKINKDKFNHWLTKLGYSEVDNIDFSQINSTNLKSYLTDYVPEKIVQKYIDTKGKIYIRETKTTQGTANKCKALLSHMYNTAMTWQGDEWELITSNPCNGIKSTQSNSKTRYLDKVEIKRLFDALNSDEYKNHQTTYFVKLLFFTGARKSELINAKWEDIDFNNKMWNKPQKSSKTKLAPPVPLSDDAIVVLNEMSKQSSIGYLFKSKDDNSKPMSNCKKSYASILQKADIKDCSFHDLRRTFGSQLLLAGVDIYTVSKLLGHNSVATTEKHYAFLDRQTLHSATNALSNVIN